MSTTNLGIVMLDGKIHIIDTPLDEMELPLIKFKQPIPTEREKEATQAQQADIGRHLYVHHYIALLDREEKRKPICDSNMSRLQYAKSALAEQRIKTRCYDTAQAVRNRLHKESIQAHREKLEAYMMRQNKMIKREKLEELRKGWMETGIDSKVQEITELLMED